MSERNTAPANKVLIYRALPCLVALCVFLAISALYLFDHGDAYFAVLYHYGIEPFKFPFVDISGSLAAWDCTRLGVDVVEYNPCDVLGRGYSYSPLWMVAAPFVPLGRSATGPVGWALGLLFIISLTLLPPVRRPWELVLVVFATSSTMVVFAVERANPDIILFLMALIAGFLARGPLPARLFAYVIALLAALIKYYPLTLLVLSFRERVAVFLANGVAMLVLIVVFLAVYLPDIERGLPLIPVGSYFTDLFAAKNLPFGLAELMVALSGGSPRSPSVGLLGASLYGLLMVAGTFLCRTLLTRTALRPTFSRIAESERIFLVIGSALIVGCFFSGQSIGYRGIFLLFVLPGLLAIARIAANPRLRRLYSATTVALVLLMWEECFRALWATICGGFGMPALVATLGRLGLWLARELAWWWLVSVLVALLLSFLAESETVRGLARLSKGYLTAMRTR